MILYMLLAIVAVGLGSDLYVWMRYFRKKKSGNRWVSMVYVTQAVLLGGMLPVAAVAGNMMMRNEGRQADVEYMVMWMMWMFVLIFVIKLIFVIFLAINDLLNKVLHRRWRFFEIIGGALVLLITGLMIHGVTYGVSTIRVNRIVITSPKIPAEFDGYRIAHFSDLHIGSMDPSGTLMDDVIDSILQLKPDLIVNSGDLIHVKSSEVTASVFRSLARLEAPDGVVSVLGNHDLSIYMSQGRSEMVASLNRLKEIQRQLGWRLLINENISITRNGDSISVAGVDYPRDGRYGGERSPESGSDLARAMKGVDTTRFSLLVAHTPSVWDSIPLVASPDLTVAGHTHAMQMKLTVGECQFSPAAFLYPEWSGLYFKDNLRLYVNDGVGSVVFPMRIGAPPEVTVYELRQSRN